MKRIASGMMLTLLFIGMLTLTFDIQPVRAKSKTLNMPDDETSDFDTRAISNGDLPNQEIGEENTVRHHSAFFGVQDFEKSREWSNFACMDEDSAELVIGINDEHGYSELENLMKLKGCYLIDNILIKNEIVASVVDVPLRAVPSFVTDVKAKNASRYIEPNIIFNACILPNDHSWRRQWGPTKIEADYAWNLQMGNASVLVAIVDTGVDWNHPDLASNFVALGYDWVNDDPDPMDDYGHGTHCAGIIAATLGNGIGIAGLAQVSIMAEKALNYLGVGYEDMLAKAIIHAVDQGAKIISMSWGGFVRSELIHDAIKYAYDTEVLLVGAAGNDAADRVTYPAAFEEVIAVAATDQFDNPAYFTSFGDWIELAAPGVDIYSTLFNDSYDYMSGTSMACPHVAGVAALVWSQFPNLSRDQVRLRLRQTADDLGDPGFDQHYGYGRINAKRAVEKTLAEHDLLIEYWEAPLVEEPGKSVKINGSILNFGKSPETEITIQLLVNNSIVDTTDISFLESNMSQKVSLLWNPEIEGMYNVTIYISPVPHENIVRNNFFSAHVSIRIPRVILVPRHFFYIEWAVNAASPGDTVLVSAGTYYELVTVAKPLKLLGRNATIISRSGSGTILCIKDAENVFISGFSIKNGNIGILLYNSNNITLRDNDLVDNGCSLQVYGSSLCDFVQDIDTSNKVNGKSVYYLVSQKTVEISGEAGYVGLVNSTNITVKNLNLNETLLLAYTVDSYIENITVSNALRGVQFYRSSNNTVSESTLLNNAYGIFLGNSWSNKIVNNDIASNVRDAHGILLWVAFTNEIDSNTITGENWSGGYWFGILLEYSGNNLLMNNIIIDNFRGVYLLYSPNNLLMNNAMIDNKYNFGVNGRSLPHFIQDIDVSNTINGKVVYYLVNQNSVVISPSRFPNAGYLGVANSTNLIIRYLSLADNSEGILLAYTNNSTIEKLNVHRNEDGMYLYESNNNKIRTNVVSDMDFGIYLCASSGNIITENLLSQMTGFALGLESSFENMILENEMSHSDFSMALWLSSNNCIYANNLTENKWGIILFAPADNNTIYHNNFIKNYVPVWNIGTENSWDIGYPSGGNYWSGNYTGVDVVRGPGQDLPDSDGIGDTPYIIDANNRDRYPLMNPWIAPPPAEVHDVAIVDVVPSVTEVYVGRVVNITITVQNEGIFPETFEVTCKYELEGTEHIIGNMTVNDLAPQASTSIVFTWTTADITVHTIKAEATILPNETGTSDNIMTSPTTVKVKILGDVNGDETIDIFDLVGAAGAFGAMRGSWAWSPQADIYPDGHIDIFDLVAIALRFGQHV